MDVRQLRYFVSIVDCRSLEKAAKKLLVAQPSLSRQLAGLEEDLGVLLLLRSKHGVTPTSAGDALYRHARLVLRQMEQLKQEVTLGGAAAKLGTVAVGLPTTMASALALPLFERVQDEYPGIRLKLLEGGNGYLNELLADGRLDLAILFLGSDMPGITALPVLDETLYVLGEPGEGVSPRSTTCPLSKLAGVKLVGPGVLNDLRLLLERTFSRENVQLNVVADVDSLTTMISIAHSVGACTILPGSAVAQLDASHLPKMRRIVNPPIERPASICWLDGLPPHNATVAVRDTIAAVIAEQVTEGAWQGVTLRPGPSAD
ncbi:MULTISPECIES: LysR substrate-binding domain-containing protein [unclassified Caballeronia]|uniref:LysR substrate-binding domain-containing protein n=1 Tax=unclassified Caballeronia TaxID=2646786 RepID=UPI00285EE23A|nr:MULTISPECIES: LysR substrate-binding domain-containing protein [unclassified Caballeronia]MDR5752379.1 LysR substrate-binding domain-containing protein [Caballeronia sp. LZ024]MDR5845184.1 LysR substrate-binding domain-containing protein [Caballeronia sp. LZ031]